MKRTKSMLTALFLGVAAIWTGSLPAGAAPIFFEFTLTGAVGPHAGTVGSGSFSIEGDDFTGTGSETFRPSGTVVTPTTGTLLTFDVEFAGVSFSIEDETDFPDGPAVSFFDGAFTETNYFSFTDRSAIDLSRRDFFTFNGAGISGTTFGPPLTVSRVAAVPEPASVWLFGSALAVTLAWARRREVSGRGETRDRRHPRGGRPPADACPA